MCAVEGETDLPQVVFGNPSLRELENAAPVIVVEEETPVPDIGVLYRIKALGPGAELKDTHGVREGHDAGIAAHLLDDGDSKRMDAPACGEARSCRSSSIRHPSTAARCARWTGSIRAAGPAVAVGMYMSILISVTGSGRARSAGRRWTGMSMRQRT